MPTYTTAGTKFVQLDGLTYAYRLFGGQGSNEPPLLMINHFRSNMDHWDPQLIDPLALTRPVLFIDYGGIGHSADAGPIPTTFAGWAAKLAEILTKGLNISLVDVLGFSMGGCAAQMLTLNFPHLVRSLIVTGSTPSAGEGIADAADQEPFRRLASADNKSDSESAAAFVFSFFEHTDAGRDAGYACWKRISTARADRIGYLDQESTKRQITAARRWYDPAFRAEGSYDRLHEINVPTLIANGSNDLLIPTSNSWTLWQKLGSKYKSIMIYPASGHGFVDQYAAEYAHSIDTFLRGSAKLSAKL